MHDHTFIKNYISIVDGILNKKVDTINLAIARKDNSIIERCVKDNGDNAITNYCVIREFNNMSLLYITLETGRTHQIRVHMSYIGHPIIGDTLYGNSSDLINRQALHAYKIKFVHPITKKHMDFEANIPTDFHHLLDI